jgi:CheY-like chemotaxis protein
VHEYGGHVCVQSARGAGATFKILLAPIEDDKSEGQAEDRRAHADTPATARLQGRVLVVDDDDMVADLLQEMLESWHLAVTVLRNPLDAHAWFLEDPSRVDLVLTDHTMPKMTGIELAQHLTMLRPDLPVILYSGYGSDIDPAAARRSGVSALIAKPVEPRTLFEVLLEHLPPSDEGSQRS